MSITFSDIRKSYSHIRKSHEFLMSENKLEFLISENFWDQKFELIFWYQKISLVWHENIRGKHRIWTRVNISQTLHIVFVFTAENFPNQKSTSVVFFNFKWQVYTLGSLYGLHEYSGAVHFIIFSWIPVIIGSWPCLLPSATSIIKYLFISANTRGNFDFLISENNSWYQ